MSPPAPPPDSGGRREQRSRRRTEPIEFFIDRSLAASTSPTHSASSATRLTRWHLYTAERAAQELQDEQWLTDVGKHGCVVLMKDDAIRRRPAERDALSAAGVRAFCLTNAQLRAPEQTARFVENIHRIVRRASQPVPYIYGVYDDSLAMAVAGGRAVYFAAFAPACLVTKMPEERLHEVGVGVRATRLPAA